MGCVCVVHMYVRYVCGVMHVVDAVCGRCVVCVNV